MTEQEINIKIAEWMGYGEGWTAQYGTCGNDIMPDYCNDLNAVWKVGAVLDKESQVKYILELKRILGLPDMYSTKGEVAQMIFNVAHATAKQRCEAIVKVLEGRKVE